MRESLDSLPGWALELSSRWLDAASGALRSAARTARFVRGRRRFVGRDDDIFVASYPRSGTTWTQAIVHLLLSGQSRFDFDHISTVSPWWERSLAWRADAASEFATLPGPRVFKTHLRPHWLPAQGRAIYLRRQPEDVAISYYRLYRQYLGFGGSFESFFRRFRDGRVQYGRWADHVAAWEARGEGSSVLFVDYERMRENPHHEIARLSRFLGIPVQSDRLSEVVSATSLGRMKDERHRFDHSGELVRQWGVRPAGFFHRGEVGGGARQLSADQRAELWRESAQRHRPERISDYLH